jgi:hypothetical protein
MVFQISSFVVPQHQLSLRSLCGYLFHFFSALFLTHCWVLGAAMAYIFQAQLFLPVHEVSSTVVFDKAESLVDVYKWKLWLRPTLWFSMKSNAFVSAFLFYM